MKIVSWNVNGLRSVINKGFDDYLQQLNPDILCIQETRMSLDAPIPNLPTHSDYSAVFASSHRPGHSGVAIYTKSKPTTIAPVDIHLPRFSRDGRSLLVQFDDIAVLNLYMPHGGRDRRDMPFKLAAYDNLLAFLGDWSGPPLLITGDFNIALDDIDLARPHRNRSNAMFSGPERTRLVKLLGCGYTDSYRFSHPDSAEYTWWPYAFQARTRNVGWRIDYIFVPDTLRHDIISARVHSEVFGSDHCPVSLILRTK